MGAVSCRGGCANRLSTGPWHKGLDKFESAAARLTSLRRASPPTRVRSFALAAMSPSPGELPTAAGTPPLQSAVFDQRSVDKDNAVTLHQDLLSLRWPSWFKILAEKQHSHRLYYREHGESERVSDQPAAEASTCCEFTNDAADWKKSKARRGGAGRAAIELGKPSENSRLKFVKESGKDPVQEASDQQRRDRLLKSDEDSGSGASQQGSELDQKQREKRRLIGQAVRSAPWI